MRPILMSAPTIRATLAGTKTVTRRLTGLDNINQQPDGWQLDRLHIENGVLWAVFADHRYPDKEESSKWARCPYGVPGDRLWVRENFRLGARYDKKLPSTITGDTRVYFEADGEKPDWAGRLRQSIHMPRYLSRIDLEVIKVFPERLSRITEDDAKREGVMPIRGEGIFGHLTAFVILWDDINSKMPFECNPWVWVINFKRIKQ